METIRSKLAQEFSKEEMAEIMEYVKSQYAKFGLLIAKYRPSEDDLEEGLENLDEAGRRPAGLSVEGKLDHWHNGGNPINYRQSKDDKLKMYHDMAVKKGYASEAEELRKEGERRDLDWAIVTEDEDELEGLPELPAEAFTPSLADRVLEYADDPEGFCDSYLRKNGPFNKVWFIAGLAAMMMAASLGKKEVFNALRARVLAAAKEHIHMSGQEVLEHYINSIKRQEIHDKIQGIIDDLKKKPSVNESLGEPFDGTSDWVEEDVERHDTLNPKLWNEDLTLKPEVKEKIDLMVEEFVDSLDKEDVKIKIKDVVLIGSNCSYNYNENSDLDVHILAETKSMKCPDDLYPALYDAYRKLFSKKFDVEFYGIPVELYIETEKLSENTVSNGCYSVKNGKWIKEPVLKDIPEVDQEALDKSVSEWEAKYQDLLNSLDVDDSALLESAVKNDDLDKIAGFVDELYKMRKDGLKEEGEYGVGNLTFKELRNKGYIQKLKALKNAIISKELSLGDEPTEEASGEEIPAEAQRIEADDLSGDDPLGDFPLDEGLEEPKRRELLMRLTRLGFGQPIVQPNGRFDFYGVHEIDVDRLLNALENVPEVEYAQKTAGKFDFSHYDVKGATIAPKRKYNVYGQLKD